MNYITRYNDLLQRGEIPACRRIKAVYARLAEETRTPGQYVFDEAKGLPEDCDNADSDPLAPDIPPEE